MAKTDIGLRSIEYANHCPSATPVDTDIKKGSNSRLDADRTLLDDVGTEHLICESKFCLTKASQASSARAAPTARRTSGRAAAAPPSWVAAHVARHVPRTGIAQMT